MARVNAARAGAHGIQILTMGQMAARLAGGFLAPIDSESLRDAVCAALPETDLGELESIKTLPGLVRAAVSTLDKVWRADIDLSSSSHPRLKSLATLEEQVLRRLPPSMKKPRVLVDLARGRLAHAAAVLGPIEIHGHSEMPLCWRPLLFALSNSVPVAWIAGPRLVPEWLAGKNIEIQQTAPNKATPELYSCATPQHEVLEAFRWMRALIAEGKARPEEIAIAAASPADFDDYVLALSRDCNIPIHFVHGIKAVASRDGQLAAALADVLVEGISQERVRRLFAILPENTTAVRDLPFDWTRILPSDAPLTAVVTWEQVFARTPASDWPEGIDRSTTVLNVLRLVGQGPTAAAETGEMLLSGIARSLWRRALQDGPPQALPVTLTRLRSDDGLEPTTHVMFASAMALASAPRPYVRLLALNSGRWPRCISEDRLIPDHVMPTDELQPLPIADADRRDFVSVLAAAKMATASFSRCDVEGRLLGRSPLVTSMKREVYLGRARIPEHAASGSDRLLARPAEFAATPAGVSARACWRDWQRPTITAHDGFVGTAHPRLQRVFDTAMSATSLRMLLRDPIRFVWRYALGWRQPEEADEPFTIDALTFGTLVHDVLRKAVVTLEHAAGLAGASTPAIEEAIAQALADVTTVWELERPVPPAVIWRNILARTKELSLIALHCPLEPFPGQRCWTEIPFGMHGDRGARTNAPWDVTKTVEIPGAGIQIQGHVDRLDLAEDISRARVIDYKTGKLRNGMANVILDGGKELQRCLYALAVKSLIGERVKVEAALLYPRAQEVEGALFPLPNIDDVLAQLVTALTRACDNVKNGVVAPGIDAADRSNDLAFALPASPSYLDRKSEPARERLGQAADIWEAA
jgi:hypothetical protein